MNKSGLVLDVGNCDPDHFQLRTMLEQHFDVRIDRVMFVDQALEKMRAVPYDLVLFNRLIFDDHSEGLELVRRAKNDPAIRRAQDDPAVRLAPMMMVSNYPEAQAAAVAAGAVEGFGKAKLFDAATVERLSRFLPRKPAPGSPVENRCHDSF